MKERRRDRHGELRLMHVVEGYVMVRRPGCMPFVMYAKEWRELELIEPKKEAPRD